MKVAKIRKKENKQIENISEEYSVKSISKILISILVIYGAFYLLTTFLINKNENKEPTNAVVDNTKITLGQLLNRSESDYYVIATKTVSSNLSYINTDYSKIYNNYINSYLQKEDSLVFYYIDLDSALNKSYLSDKNNITNDISKLKLNDEVLFKINNGKIEKYYVGKDKIIEKLSKM